VKNQLVGNNVV